jgi:hypothetical protein
MTKLVGPQSSIQFDLKKIQEWIAMLDKVRCADTFEIAVALSLVEHRIKRSIEWDKARAEGRAISLRIDEDGDFEIYGDGEDQISFDSAMYRED